MENFTEELDVIDDLNIPVYLSFTIVLFAIGFIGNSLIILSVVFNERLQARGYSFTLNLAVSDLAVLFLSDFFVILGIAIKGKLFSDNLQFCVISSYLCSASCITSIWNIGVGSFHSYVRICHRLRYHKIFKTKAVACANISTWLIGFLFLAPSLNGWGDHHYSVILRYCILDYEASYSYTIFLITFGVLLPIGIATYSFLRIILHVLLSRRRLRNTATLKDTRFVHRNSLTTTSDIKTPPLINSRDARLLRSFVFICFYLTGTWLFLLVIWIYGTSATWTSRQQAYAMTIAHSHCSVNGLLYALTNKDFRIASAKILRCGRDPRSPIYKQELRMTSLRLH